MIEDLLAEDGDHFEGLSGCEGVYEHVAVDADEVLGVQDTVFVLGGVR